MLGVFCVPGTAPSQPSRLLGRWGHGGRPRLLNGPQEGQRRGQDRTWLWSPQLSVKPRRKGSHWEAESQSGLANAVGFKGTAPQTPGHTCGADGVTSDTHVFLKLRLLTCPHEQPVRTLCTVLPAPFCLLGLSAWPMALCDKPFSPLSAGGPTVLPGLPPRRVPGGPCRWSRALCGRAPGSPLPSLPPRPGQPSTQLQMGASTPQPTGPLSGCPVGVSSASRMWGAGASCAQDRAGLVWACWGFPCVCDG